MTNSKFSSQPTTRSLTLTSTLSLALSILSHVSLSTSSTTPTVSTLPIAPSVSSTPASSPAKSNTPVLGIVLGIIGALAVIVIIFLTIRMKRRSPSRNTDSEASNLSRHGKPMDAEHPASRITPFGSLAAGDTLRSKHNPGSDMRIATRGLDGAWHFSESTIPQGSTIEDIDRLASQSRLNSPDRQSGFFPLWKRGHESKLSREILSEYSANRDLDPDPFACNPPPPAYAREYVGYINHTQSPS